MKTEKNLCVVTGNLIEAKKVFTAGGAEKLLEPLRQKLKEFVPDLSTKKGRAEIASFAAKFSKSKTLVDKLGKGLKDEYTVLIKPIDQERRIFKTGCDALRDEARKPLTEWEAEQERIVEIERQQVIFDLEHEEALGINDLFNRERAMAIKEAEFAKIEADRKAKEEAEQAEKDRVEYEAKIKADAEEKAKREAEDALLFEQQEKERVIQEAKDRENQLKIDAENAEKKRLADIQAEKDRAEREKQEFIAQQKRDQEAKEHAEAKRIADEKVIADRKAANMNHQKGVNRKVVAKLMSIEMGVLPTITEAMALKIANDIVKNPIPQITINYGG